MTETAFDGIGADFAAHAAGELRAKAITAKGLSAKAGATVSRVTSKYSLSKELRTLFVDYCASQTQAQGLEGIKWELLAARLGTTQEFLIEMAAALDSTEGDTPTLWDDVIYERVKRLGAARAFRDISWERLEQRTLAYLLELAEAKMIRDPSELLAIAAAARKVNNGDTGSTPSHVNINLGGGDMSRDGTLPPAGARISIDLSPRMATRLQEPPRERGGERVIDGEMLGAQELREVLVKNQQAKVIDSEANEGE